MGLMDWTLDTPGTEVAVVEKAAVEKSATPPSQRTTWSTSSGHPNGGMYFSSGTGPDTSHSISRYMSAIMLNPTGRRVVDMISEGFSRALLDVTSPGTEEALEKHGLIDLFRNPEPKSRLTYQRFMRQVGQDFCLAGMSLHVKQRGADGFGASGPVQGLWRIAPQRLTVFGDRDDRVLAFLYINRLGQQTWLRPGQVVYSYLPHPEEPWRGISPAMSALASADTDNMALQWNIKSLTNDAGVPMFIAAEDMGVEEFIELKAAWKRDKNPGMAKFLNGKITAVQAAMSNKDMMYDTLRTMAEDGICRAYGIPTVAVNPTEGTFNNSEQGAKSVWQGRIDPWVLMYAGDLTVQLGHDSGYPDADIKRDVSHIEELQESADSKNTRVIARLNAGLLSRDEARDELGYDPMEGEGGDSHQWVGTITVSDPETGLPRVPEPPAANPMFMHALPGSTAPAAGQTAPVEPAEPTKSADTSVTKSTDETVVGGHPVADHADTHVGSIQRFIAREFRTQGRVAKKRFIAASNKTSKSTTKDADSDYDLDQIVDSTRFGDRVREDYPDYLTAVVGGTSDTVRQQLRAAISGMTDWSLDEEAVKTWMATRADYLAKQLNETTVKLVGELIASMTATGSPIEDIADKIGSQFDDWAGADDRAMTIARTESMSASNWAGLQSAKDSGVVTGKTWMSTSDEICCDICDGLDGTTVGLDDSFDDTDQPPGHPNCRCTLVYVLSDGTDDDSTDDSDTTGAE